MMGKELDQMNLCACGCGISVKGTWKRGHIGKSPDGKRKITNNFIVNPFVFHDDQKRYGVASRRYRKIRAASNTFHCDLCKISEWQGQKLSLVVDHIDGKCWNDVLENLRLVCPNCDSLLPTHGGRNKTKRLD